MKNAVDFIVFALTHAKRESIPEGAKLPIGIDECGSDPWEYLYGTTGARVTQALLDERYEHFYSKKGWSREAFATATENWAALRRRAADCQGLLDSFLGTDVTANYCYSAWCTERGAIDDIERPFEIGEAVFFRNSDGRMSHVGFICGFENGEPLAVEARGIRFGVVVTRLSERPWTHRGLVTQKLSYDREYRDEPVVLAVKSPMIQGEHIMHLQKALNALGYYCGAPDGRCGRITMSGVREFVSRHAAV
ncbi:MAG: peptidoglycan-binding protein [Clostridia bacterium]|nr:peptidoglycan-binding protein [Clostridia bacterium]